MWAPNARGDALDDAASRFVAREAPSVASRLCVSGMVRRRASRSARHTYIARGCVRNLDLNEASVKVVRCGPENGVWSL